MKKPVVGTETNVKQNIDNEWSVWRDNVVSDHFAEIGNSFADGTETSEDAHSVEDTGSNNHLQENNLDEESSDTEDSSEGSNIVHLQENSLDETNVGDAAELPVSPPVARPRVVTPTVAPRRSTRPTKKPNWMGTGEFAMPISVDIPDWERRANYLKDLLGTAPESVRAHILTAIVNIISSQT